MSSHKPAEKHTETARDLSRKHVVVTGAGFTHALVPDAPLLVDDFHNDVLKDKIRGLPNASQLLEWERSRHPKGHINIERLMTRLDALMPYDYAENAVNAANEYGFFLSELKTAFLDRLHQARNGHIFRAELDRFAKYCETKVSCCITFNYDDFLDQALAENCVWSPDWGYGFFCQSSHEVVASVASRKKTSGLHILKLHGSINWRLILGYTSPVAIDSITHHQDWYPDLNNRHSDYLYQQVSAHLEPEPVMVPPVLSKSSLVGQPVLRLVWSHAFASLASAHEVTFIGYSFPATDMAARTLFSEALKDLHPENLNVVNLSRDHSEAEFIRERYRSVLGDIPDKQFHFDGALEWIRGLSMRRYGQAPKGRVDEGIDRGVPTDFESATLPRRRSRYQAEFDTNCR